MLAMQNSVGATVNESDEFLNDFEVVKLTRALRDIARMVPELGRIARRETSPPGGRLARNPTVPGSRPPLNLSALHLVDELTRKTWGWVTDLYEHCPDVSAPEDNTLTAVARYLALHADRIGQQVFGREVYRVVVEQWHQHLTNMIEPPERVSTAEDRGLTHIEVVARAETAVGSAADMVAVHREVTGETLRESTLRSWRARGQVTKRHGPGGEAFYAYYEVAQCAEKTKNRRRRGGPLRREV